MTSLERVSRDGLVRRIRALQEQLSSVQTALIRRTVSDLSQGGTLTIPEAIEFGEALSKRRLNDFVVKPSELLRKLVVLLGDTAHLAEDRTKTLANNTCTHHHLYTVPVDHKDGKSELVLLILVHWDPATGTDASNVKVIEWNVAMANRWLNPVYTSGWVM